MKQSESLTRRRKEKRKEEMINEEGARLLHESRGTVHALPTNFRDRERWREFDRAVSLSNFLRM